MQPMPPRLIPRLKQPAITPANPAQRRMPTTPHLHPRRAVPPTKNRNATRSTHHIFRITLGDNMKLRALIATSTLFAALAVPMAASALDVNIAADLASVEVMHGDQKVTIMRNQDQKNTVNPDFAKTSRKCPPFCIQPGELAPGVETIGELVFFFFLFFLCVGVLSFLVVVL